MNSRFVILSEPAGEELERVRFLEMNPWSTIRGVQKELDSLRRVPQPLVAVYHTLIPMRAYICAHDSAARRIVVLHGKGDGLLDHLEPRRTWLDAVVCVNEESRELAQKCLPHLKAERFLVVPVPITPCSAPPRRPSLADRPVLLGYSGRLLKEHKRVDRLPELCGQLDALGVDYRLEILGDGPEKAWLQRQFAGNSKIEFLGRRSGEEYRQKLAASDFIVFVSDTEGQPVSLLEAMSAGALPLFPKIHSAGDAYTETVEQRLLYAPGATAQAAQAIAQLSRLPDSELDRLRSRALEAVRPNLDGTYFAELAALARRVLALPRASTDEFPWHPAALEYLPMALVSRIALLRRRLFSAAGRRANRPH